LVQGPRSARAAIEIFFSNKAMDQWIVYDPRSGEILCKKGIPYRAADFYFNGETAKLREYEDIAQRLSLQWFQDAPSLISQEPDLKPGMFYSRTFNYYFIVIFKAFHLLERIHQQEGPCQLWTARSSATSSRSSLRWGKDESPIPLLLECFNKHWQFDVQYFDVPNPKTLGGRPQRKMQKNVIRITNQIKSRFLKGSILVSGNPLLLNPIQDACHEHFGLNSISLRPISGNKSLLRAFDRTSLLVWNKKDSIPSTLNFNASHLYSVLRTRKTFQIEGFDFLPVVWKDICDFYQQEVPFLLKIRDEIECLLGEAAPSYVITDEDSTEFNRQLVYLSRKRDIPTMVVLHGFPMAPLGFVPLVADHIAVWGRQIQTIFKEWKVAEDRIFITGCPKFDSLCKTFEGSRDLKQNICKKFDWSPEGPLVLVLAPFMRQNALENFEGINWNPSFVLEFADFILKLAQDLPTVNFIYKFHSGTWDSETYQRVVRKNGGIPQNMKWITRGIATDYIPASNIVFTDTSSGGFEAILLQKPVVYMDFISASNYYPLGSYGVQTVNSLDVIRKICRSLDRRELPLNEWVERQEKAVEAFLHSRDGQSAFQVAKIIKQRLSSRASMPSSKNDQFLFSESKHGVSI